MATNEFYFKANVDYETITVLGVIFSVRPDTGVTGKTVWQYWPAHWRDFFVGVEPRMLNVTGQYSFAFKLSHHTLERIEVDIRCLLPDKVIAELDSQIRAFLDSLDQREGSIVPVDRALWRLTPEEQAKYNQEPQPAEAVDPLVVLIAVVLAVAFLLGKCN